MMNIAAKYIIETIILKQLKLKIVIMTKQKKNLDKSK